MLVRKVLSATEVLLGKKTVGRGDRRKENKNAGTSAPTRDQAAYLATNVMGATTALASGL
jgi:hypothetical protein